MRRDEILKIEDLEVLNKLSKDKDHDVREYVAQNEFVSEEILDLLSRDNERLVRQAVAGNINTSIDTLTDLCKESPVSVARNPKADIETLEYIAENAKDWYDEDSCYLDCLSEVVKHENVTEEIIKICLKEAKTDKSGVLVAQSAVENEKVGSGFLKKLTDYILENEKYCVCNFICSLFDIINHENVTKEILARLVDFRDKEVSSKARDKLKSLLL